MKKWNIEDSKELYNINGWGASYFNINEKGNVYVSPCKDNTQIDRREVIDELSLRDVTPPYSCVFRISLTTVSRKRPVASRKLQKNIITMVRNSSYTPLR